jgi:hypothetical protein
MSIFTGAPIKSRVGTKSGVVRCGNNCLSYNANNGSPLSARCRRGSARHPWPHRSVDTLRGYVRDAELSSMLSATSSESLGGEEALLDCDAPRVGVGVAVAL